MAELHFTVTQSIIQAYSFRIALMRKIAQPLYTSVCAGYPFYAPSLYAPDSYYSSAVIETVGLDSGRMFFGGDWSF